MDAGSGMGAVCEGGRPNSNISRRGAAPDIEINDELLGPFMDADDPEMAFSLDLIARQKAANR